MRIEDYAFLSDTQTGALVSLDGSVDWLCMPRFDSAACFARLLGTEQNGFWKIAPSEPIAKTRRAYRDDGLILDTVFTTESGKVQLTDFMPLRDESPDFIRIVEGLEGRVAMRMDLVIRFDYGLTEPWVRQTRKGWTAICGPNAFLLQSDVETHGADHSTAAQFTVKPGQKVAFVLTWYPSHRKAPRPAKSSRALKGTESYWQEWSAHCKTSHGWSEAVKRSLLVLKGLTYQPTGGIVAAATTSLPEQLGGERNWDYRFCWLRDATFTLNALLTAGYTGEAEAWRDWLLRAVAGAPSQIQVLYGVAGERMCTEVELSHLDGYEGSKPVRSGNAAAGQFQLDIYGEIMDTMLQARKAGLKPDKWAWKLEEHLADFVMENWREPDDGIWEVRGGRRMFTHSRMMAWVALDRAVKACEHYKLQGGLKRWKAVRDQIHREVCEQGFNKERGAFTQSFGCDRLDASLLMMPLVGFLPADDPRVKATIEAIEKELMVDGFVLRYHPASSEDVDGLPPGEGAFLPCTFWMADCLNLIGRKEEAKEIFERVAGVSNDLGLLAEEYDVRAGRMVGNFPQTFSHVALVNSARYLHLMECRDVPDRDQG